MRSEFLKFDTVSFLELGLRQFVAPARANPTLWHGFDHARVKQKVESKMRKGVFYCIR